MARRKADRHSWEVSGVVRVADRTKHPAKRAAPWRRTRTSNAELVGLRQHHLQHGHEGGRLAEVAAADDVGVDVQALCVGARLDGPRYAVESSDDGRRELSGGETAELEINEIQSNRLPSEVYRGILAAGQEKKNVFSFRE